MSKTKAKKPKEEIEITPCSFWGLKSDEVERFVCAENAFTSEECDEIIKIGKSKPLGFGTISINGIGNKSIRDSQLRFIGPSENEILFRKLTDIITSINNDFFKFDLWGFAEGLQFTEYGSPGGKYSEHIDKVYGGIVRKLTLVLQLTDPKEYKGGYLELLDDGYYNPQKMKKERGSLIVFPSYSLHRVTPIKKGTRHSLVGWLTGPQFR